MRTASSDKHALQKRTLSSQRAIPRPVACRRCRTPAAGVRPSGFEHGADIGFYSADWFCKEKNARPFLLSGILLHRPRRCSCPTPATKNRPEFANARAFTYPATGSCPISSSTEFSSPHFHSLTTPSQDPEATRSVYASAAQDAIQFATPCASRPWAGFFIAVGFFFCVDLHEC